MHVDWTRQVLQRRSVSPGLNIETQLDPISVMSFPAVPKWFCIQKSWWSCRGSRAWEQIKMSWPQWDMLPWTNEPHEGKVLWSILMKLLEIMHLHFVVPMVLNPNIRIWWTHQPYQSPQLAAALVSLSLGYHKVVVCASMSQFGGTAVTELAVDSISISAPKQLQLA
jgi:hypothetical protein